MAYFNEVFNLITRNGVIGANASEAFGQDVSSREAKNKYGSFNSASVTILDTNGAIIKIDGLTSRTFELAQPGNFKIKPEEGYFFDWLTITDRSGAGMLADKADIKIAIAQEVR